jgi:hypothetical protein
MSRNSKRVYSTIIKVHPAVFRYIDNTFSRVRDVNSKAADVYDLRRHLLYNFVSVGLSRSSISVPSMIPLQYEKMKTVKVAITSWDYHHYGWDIPPIHQVALSNHIYKQILFDACYRIMICHVFGGLPRDKAIKDFLAEHCFEESELNYAALRKHYQRHWIEIEMTAKSNCAEYSTNTSCLQPKYNTKKNVGIVPFVIKK